MNADVDFSFSFLHVWKRFRKIGGENRLILCTFEHKTTTEPKLTD